MNNIIEGMTILEQTMITEMHSSSVVVLIVGVLIAVVSLFPMAIGLRNSNIKIRNVGVYGYVLGIILMLSLLIFLPLYQVETGRYKYKCTLEDNVSANYIEEHFDVIDVRDGIWTISDKDTD